MDGIHVANKPQQKYKAQ